MASGKVVILKCRASLRSRLWLLTLHPLARLSLLFQMCSQLGMTRLLVLTHPTVAFNLCFLPVAVLNLPYFRNLISLHFGFLLVLLPFPMPRFTQPEQESLKPPRSLALPNLALQSLVSHSKLILQVYINRPLVWHETIQFP